MYVCARAYSEAAWYIRLQAEHIRLQSMGHRLSTCWAIRTMAVLTMGKHRDVRPQWYGWHGARRGAEAMHTPG